MRRNSLKLCFRVKMEWSDIRAFVHEIEQLYSREDDIRSIEEIKKMSEEIDLYYNSRLKSAKELIKGRLLSYSFSLCSLYLSIYHFLDMVDDIGSKEAALMTVSPEEHEKLLRRIQSERDSLLNDINALNSQIEKTRSEIIMIADDNRALKEETAKHEEEIKLQDSRTAYAVSLYSRITNIDWDYGSPSNILSGRKSVIHFLRD